MLIEIYSDFIRNKKDLRDYIELRKTIHGRGEFNDNKLLKIQENLEKLKAENPEIYEKMYAVLEEVYKRDEGNFVDYPLDFSREILKMFQNQSLESIYEEYKATLAHKYQTLN